LLKNSGPPEGGSAIRGTDAEHDAEQVLTALRRAANDGDSAAKAKLAETLLTRPPYGLAEGVSWALSGARDGNGDAAHLAALLSAWGLGLQQDWQAALDFLRIAAQSGHDGDARVLAGLAGDWALARGLEPGEKLSAARCADLRERIRIDDLLKAPPARIASDWPRIAVNENFLPPGMCDWLIARARPNLVRAKVYDPSTGIRDAAVRTNTEFHIGTFASDLIVMILQQRIATLTRLMLAGMEACTILRYGPGEEFKPHVDYFDVSNPENARIIAAEGQRVLTFLIYLNTDYSGGETEFQQLGWRYRGGKGDALWFVNVNPDFSPNPRTLHAGLPPVSGEKWLFSQWIRGRLPGTAPGG
jgi:prolyl 4-hydroxylase